MVSAETTTIQGFVQSPDGDVMDNATVTVYGYVSDETNSTSTDQTGYYMLTLEEGYTNITVLGGIAGSLPYHVDLLLLAGGQSWWNVTLQMDVDAFLEGFVLDDDGDAVSNVSIELQDLEQGFIVSNSTVSDFDGSYLLGTNSGGSYLLLAYGDGYEIFTTFVDPVAGSTTVPIFMEATTPVTDGDGTGSDTVDDDEDTSVFLSSEFLLIQGIYIVVILVLLLLLYRRST